MALKWLEPTESAIVMTIGINPNWFKMALKINSHVTRLNRYLPFSVAHDQIYDEYQSDDSAIALGTVAYEYMVKALEGGAKCIILTGDAGHGKTHLCRKIIRDLLGYDFKETSELLLNKCDGKHAIQSSSGTGFSLRIHKDFSEIAIDQAAEFLEEYGSDSARPLIICANEGRLRAIVSSSNAAKVCKKIQLSFSDSFVTGLASSDGELHIINLNYQSVAANKNDEKSLLRRSLKWVLRGTSWNRVCDACSYEKRCPINRNREMLSTEEGVSESRVAKIETLCATVERLGHVITIREMLMLVSYLVTGGMTCADVEKRCQRNKDGWQNKYAFYNLIFSGPPSIPDDRLLAGIPILEDIRKLDPGKIATRSVDDRLLNIGGVFPSGDIDLAYSLTQGIKQVDAANGIDDVIGTPQSRSELSAESETVRNIVSGLRRRSFFDEAINAKDMLLRLGFRHGSSFLAILDGGLTAQEKVRIKNQVVAGLHGIQGLRLSTSETTLYLVDPAFGKASSDAAILACQVPTRDIQLLTEKEAWNTSGETYPLSSSVDWIDRSVVVRVFDSKGLHVDIPLDLMAFECVARSASGFIYEDFYAHQMRKVRTILGTIAERHTDHDGQISVFLDGKIMTISIDSGVVQVSGRG